MARRGIETVTEAETGHEDVAVGPEKGLGEERGPEKRTVNQEEEGEGVLLVALVESTLEECTTVAVIGEMCQDPEEK